MSTDKHLVPVTPALFADFACPRCGKGPVQAKGTVFPGIHVLGDYVCGACGHAFLRDLPVGFAVDHPMVISKQDGTLLNPDGGASWIHDPLMEGWRSKNNDPVKIEHIVHRECDRVVILNTLDYLYGHVLLKLFGASYYLKEHPGKGLVLILPKMYAWLIPDGVAEVWLVDQKLSQTQGWHTAIDAFVQEQLPRYKEVLLGKGYAHPEFADIDIVQYSKVEAFRLEDYQERPKHVTFILRTDRLWFGSALEKLIWRGLHPLGLRKSIGKWILWRQAVRMRRTMRSIRAHVPDVSFTVVGLGEPGGFGGLAEDRRTTRMDSTTETTWCKAYARSQFVIGVHGSNMLLPTAHAAGCLEILPHDRYGNIVQDVCVRWHDRMQLFLYRFVDEFASSNTVARNAVSMFRDFDVYHRDNRQNIFNTER